MTQLDTLRKRLTSALFRAQERNDPMDWLAVARLQARLSKLLPPESGEGQISRRGAFRAADKAYHLLRRELFDE